MYSFTRRGPGKGTALLAVLQAILLLSALVLAPAAVIAQEAPDAGHEPVTETTGEPAADPTPEPTSEPKAERRERPKATPRATPRPSVEKTLGEQGWTIRLFPQQVKVAVGGKVVVGAYKCRVNDRTPFGGPTGSGDPKDYCDPIRVKWSVEGAGATTSNTFGKKTKLTLLDDSAPIRLIATVDDLKRPTKVIVKQKAAKNRPEALTPEQIADAQAGQRPPSEPRAEEPRAEEPTEEPADCLVDPVTGECLVELPTERVREAPAEEPSEAPAEEPTEEPAAEPAEDRSADCLADPVTGECLVELPIERVREAPVAEAPAEEPTEAPDKEPKVFELAASGSMSLTTHQGQLSDGTYTTGNVTEYSELDFVNFRFTITADGPGVGTMSVHFTGEDSVCTDTFFTQAFHVGTHDASAPVLEVLSGAVPAVSLDGPVTKDGEDWRQDLTFTYAAAGQTRYNYNLQLSKYAGDCSPGSPQHSQVDNFGGDFSNTGEKTVPIPSSKVLENPTVTAIKWVDRGDGSYVKADEAEFGFQLDGAGAYVPIDGDATVVFDPDPPLSDGDHTIREQQLAGSDVYEFDHGDGTNCTFDVDGVATANVAKGQDAKNATCNFYNKIANGTLELRKTVENDDGGIATEADFQARIDGADVDWDDPVELAAGTYTASEVMNVSGYTASDWGGDCAADGSITIAGGDTAVCTITNSDDTPSLKLVKVVDNGDTGSQNGADDWTLTASAASPWDGRDISTAGGSHVAADVFANAEYTLAESGPAGYSASAWDCTDGTLVGDKLTLGLGDDAVCTITNTAQPATLKLVKTVENDDGGIATEADFQARIDGADVPWNAAQAVSVGAHTASEVALAGGAGYTASVWGGDCAADGSVTIALGDNLTCSITNSDDTPSLKLVKVVDNGDTGSQNGADDWTLTASAASPWDGRDISTAGGSHVAADVFANAEYTLAESGPAGYSASAWDCTDGTLVGDKLTLGLGDDAVCTITNTAQPATLKLVKTVENDDGGIATEADFQARIDGADVPWNAAQAVSVGAHTASEVALAGGAGYTASVWGGDCAADGSVTIALGDNLTCSITNSDDTPSLKLVKVVDNGDTGSQNGADDWTLTASAASPWDGRDISTAGGSHVAADVFANAEYTLAESGPAGYSASAWDCTDGTLVGDKLTLGLGDDAVCTITNTAQPATLKLVKTVENDDGGIATEADFQARIDGADVPWNAAQAVSVGAHTASEVALAGGAGYTASVWGGDCAADGSVTIALGDNLTCSITNSDDTPSLKLVKVVDNGDTGSQNGADDWTLTASAASPWDGRDISTAGGSHVAADVFANAEYTLAESGPAGYSASAWDCTDGTLVGDKLTLGLGDDAVCTITNTAQPATLKLVKTVENDDGGIATEADFQARIDGADVPWNAAQAVSVGAHTASEVALAGGAGYTASVWGGDCAADGSVTIALGDNLTCSITNSDIAPTLTIIKRVTMDDGGDATVDDFNVTTSAGDLVFDDGDGGAPTNSYTAETLTVMANAEYSLSEDDVAGYTEGNWICRGVDAGSFDAGAVTLALDEDVTCEITNNDNFPFLTVVKNVMNGANGTATVADFDVTTSAGDLVFDGGVGTNPTVYTATAIQVDANTEYTLSELAIDDYVEGSWSCNGEPAGAFDAGSVTLLEGEQVTCEITNYFAELTVEKTGQPAFYAEVGDIIDYTITATNTGLATLNGVTVVDEFPTGLDDFECTLNGTGDPIALPYDGLVPGDYIECTASHTITEADIEAESVFNSACADADEIAEEVCDDTTVYYSDLEIVKTADVDYFDEVGDVINYTVTASNTGQTALTGVDITDSLAADLIGWECKVNDAGDPIGFPLASLAAGDDIVCRASYSVDQDDFDAGNVNNAACADSVETNEVCDDVDTPKAELEIVKSASVDYFTGADEEIAYTITATNVGLATLTNVDITDSLIDELPDWECSVGDAVTTMPVDELLAGQSITCTATYTTTAGDVEVGTVFNQACVDATETGPECDDVEIPYAELEIVKTADVEFFNAVGDEIVYTVTATNTGAAELTNVDISDSLIADIPDWTCDPTTPVATLAPEASIECTGTYTVDQADYDAGSVTNAACVSSTETEEICDEVETPLAELEIVKEADVEFFNAVGDEIVYTVTATNTGAAELTNVDISDSLIADIPDWTCDPTTPVATLAPEASIECTGTYTVDQADIDAGSVTNAACVSSTETEETCDEIETPLAELEIVKTASHATFGAVGDEIVYTITATNTGEADLEDVDISDELIDGLTSWSCDPGNPVDLLEPGDSIVCEATYVISQADVDAQEVLNTACADSDQTPEVCDDVVVDFIDITLVKTASVPSVGATGDEVTFTLEYGHTLDEPAIYLYALEDDIYGDLLDAGNTDVTDNTCVGDLGIQVLPNVVYTCEFTGPVEVALDDPHVNVATVTVTDTQLDQPPAATEPRFASASDDAVVLLAEEQTTPFPSPSPSPTLTPTDMLPTTDSFGGSDSDPMGGLFNWAIWLMLSALLIIGTGGIIRREKLAAVKNR